jgi:hypothetical protein
MSSHRYGVTLAGLTAVWLLIGTYPLILRATFCPSQPLHQTCTITLRQ